MSFAVRFAALREVGEEVEALKIPDFEDIVGQLVSGALNFAVMVAAVYMSGIGFLIEGSLGMN